MSGTRHIIVFLVALSLSANAAAQHTSFGLYNSVKGFGFSLNVANGEGTWVDALILFADIYGFPTARTHAPGIKFNYSREFIIHTIETPEVLFSFYFGPGFSAGYVKDYEKSYFQDITVHLTNNHGFVAALSGTGGCRFNFTKHIELDLSFTLEAGLHIRKDEKQDNIHVGLYKNGIFESFYPQLSILSYF